MFGGQFLYDGFQAIGRASPRMSLQSAVIAFSRPGAPSTITSSGVFRPRTKRNVRRYVVRAGGFAKPASGPEGMGFGEVIRIARCRTREHKHSSSLRHVVALRKIGRSISESGATITPRRRHLLN